MLYYDIFAGDAKVLKSTFPHIPCPIIPYLSTAKNKPDLNAIFWFRNFFALTTELRF